MGNREIFDNLSDLWAILAFLSTIGRLGGVWAVLALFWATLYTVWHFEKFRAYVGTMDTFGQCLAFLGNSGTSGQSENCRPF